MSHKFMMKLEIKPVKMIEKAASVTTAIIKRGAPETLLQATIVGKNILEQLGSAFTEMANDPELALLMAQEMGILPDKIESLDDIQDQINECEKNNTFSPEEKDVLTALMSLAKKLEKANEGSSK